MKILIARDEAFNFTYRANVDWLRKMGDVEFFSPMNDDANKIFGEILEKGNFRDTILYLPGGYPELFLEQLDANTTMRSAIRKFAEEDGRIFAECGGFMYLCKCIDGAEMCGVLPLEATMDGARLHLGYRQMEWNGMQIKGHEFHYSSIKPCSLPPDVHSLCLQQTASGKPVDTPIYRYRNVVAGYTHWYWADKKIEDFISLWL